MRASGPMAYISPWRIVIRKHPGRIPSSSWLQPQKLLWTILILLLPALTGCSLAGEDPRWRRSAGLAHEQRFVTTNGLDQEIHSTHDHKYQLMLDELSGDFGIKSEVVAAAFKEPEYRGADTVVVPLYIPRGAIPIRLARIARSGSPDVLPLDDLKISASDDSILLRRVGLPHQGRRRPPSRLMGPPWRSRTELKEKNKQSDVHKPKNIRTPPPISTTPTISIQGYGQRIKNSGNTGSQGNDSSHTEEEIEIDVPKRTKKNELSKNSQFPGDLSSTESSIIQTTARNMPSLNSTKTPEDMTSAKASDTKSKSLVSSIESVPSDIKDASESSKVSDETTPIARSFTTLTTINEISSTTETIFDKVSSTTESTTSVKPSINSSGLSSPNNVTSIKTTTPRTLKRINLFKPVLSPRAISTESENKNTFGRNSSSKERTEHRSVLFPRPVEAILKIAQSPFTTSTPSTTTLTTTQVYDNTTIVTSRIPTRNKTRIRPRLSRIKSSSTFSSTTPKPSSTTSDTITSSTTTATTTTTTTSSTTSTTSSTTTSTTVTPTESTTPMPTTTTNNPLGKDTNRRLSATTKKLQLITQKPPAFPVKFVTSNFSFNPSLQHRSRIKERLNREKISSESALDIRKEIKEFIEISGNIKSPQTTAEKTLRIITQNNTRSSDDPETDEEVRPIELITLKNDNEKDDLDERESIHLAELGEISSTLHAFTSIQKHENSNRPNGTRVRKRRPGWHEHSNRPNGTRVRKRRPGLRYSTTSPAPSSTFNTSDSLSVFSTKAIISPVTEIPHKHVTFRPHKFTPSSSEATTVRTKSIGESIFREALSRTPPKRKSHEAVVLESLSEIMRDATNQSGDRVSSIASDLEALNERLAKLGIFIINAEVDGVNLKLNNTFGRGTYPFQTTSNPNNPQIPTRKSTIITRHPSASTNIRDVLQPTTPLREFPVDNKSENQMQTSVSSSFSMHTSKSTDIEGESDSDNEVRSTTLNSYFTTPQSIDSNIDDNKPNRSFTPTSILSSLEYQNDDSVERNASDTLLTSIKKSQTQPVKTFITTHNPEIESPDESSISISATTTIPASVTTRTRSTTVPINQHRPTLRPLMVRPKDRYTSGDDDDDEENSNENSNEDYSSEQNIHSKLHPTSHLRPSQKNSPPASTSDTVTSFSSTTSIDPNSPADLQVLPVEVIDYSSIPETKSSTTIYIVAVIGIIPGAVAIAFFVKRYLNKDEKSLPDSEEQAEGFTPVTQHSRKHSQSNPLPTPHESPGSRTSEDIPSLPIAKTPWEFPRSKLRLVSILGEGNFGVVWKAEARDLCGCGENGTGGPTVLVAVKSVKDGAGLKEREDLIKELDIMQHLGQHPNVVTLLGCCTQTEPHLVIMEYVMFGKLLTFLRDVRTRHKYYNFSADNEALTSKDLTRFACDVASGCEYLQSRGIIHRDLAARNILVDHNKVCKIADFGLARSVKDLGSDIYEQKSRGALPIRWMAPESLYMSIFTHKSDVWSFGILCWEIVTLGSTPYPGMTAREVMRRVREGYRLDRPEHCRSELYLIVNKCWHQDLNKRPSFSEIKLELAQLLDHQMGYVDLENFPEASYYSMHANNEEKL